MAYMDTMAAFRDGAALAAPLLAPDGPATDRVVAPALDTLEWEVVHLAARDRPSSLRPQGRLGRLAKTLFGWKTDQRLADPRLEALRRIAVLSWRRGYSIESHEVSAFVAAGFSAAQYELVVDHIGAIRMDRRRRNAF